MMLQNHRRVFIHHVLPQVVAKLRVTVTVRIALPVFVPKHTPRYTNLCQLFGIICEFVFYAFVPVLLIRRVSGK